MAIEFDKQTSLGFRMDNASEAWIIVATKTQQPAIHQIAGPWFQNQQLLHGLNGCIHTGKHQHQRATIRHQGHRVQRRLSHHCEGSFGTSNQSGEVELIFLEQITQHVAAGVTQQNRLMVTNERIRFR